MQASSTPSLGIRVNHGLPEVVELDHELSSTSIPIANLDPRAYGYKFRHKHATTTTAFWPGENREYCHLWMLSLANIKSNIRNLGEHNYGSIIQQKMILASFTQALAHASYLGFGPVTELTYPIVQQSLLSDGQKWYLSVFQMNTCALHSERAAENPVSNILWLNNEQQLFEVVDETGVKGFNPEVLSNIICMYLKKGTERENPTPYLAPYKYLAKFPAPEEYRDDFHRTLLQYIYSGRPRPTARPEIYNWEKIYKVDFKTRLYEPPRRFFEPHFNQWHPGRRRFDDYKPPYIVKAHRDKKSPRNKPRIDTEHLYKYD
ncbi:hypothetical protein SK128_004923 [Halocaridina rubra]|uniref:Uncharacterized protein n=1 Tax=Halocaridina rubra TaxID=373956 RepID=A0AAN8ZYH9_HALRR